MKFAYTIIWGVRNQSGKLEITIGPCFNNLQIKKVEENVETGTRERMKSHSAPPELTHET